MRNIKIKNITIVLALALLFSVIGILTIGFSKERVFAEESVDLRKIFTDSDYLKNEDGTLSSTDIGDFDTNLNNTPYGTEVSELTQVVPVEYLRPERNVNRYHAYMGKEYGYVVKHYTNIDYDLNEVVLCVGVYVVDFVWWGEQKNLARLRIEPIIMEEFIYESDENGEKWIYGPIPFFDFNISIANASFEAAMYNENALNYGDNGYDKKADKGLYFINNWLDFSGVYAMEGGTPTAAEVLNIFVSIGGMGKRGFSSFLNTASIVTSIYEVMESFTLKQESVGQNISEHVITYPSYTEQVESKETESLSKAVSVRGQNEVLIPLGGHIETVMTLSETNKPTRLQQMMQFEIWDGDHDNWSGEYVNIMAGEENAVFSVYNEQILFDEDRFVPGVGLNAPLDFYILAYGQQRYKFNTVKNGNYSLFVDTDKPFSGTFKDVETREIIPCTYDAASKSCTAYLEAGKTYILTAAFDDPSAQGVFDASIAFNPPKAVVGTNTLSFSGNAQEYLTVDFGHNAFYRFETDEPGAVFTLYDANFNVLQTATGSLRVEDSAAITRYLEVKLPAAATKEVSVNCLKQKDITFDDAYGQHDPMTVTEGVAFELPQPEKAGMNFLGWYTTEDFSGQAATEEDIFTLGQASIVLHARWQAIVYDVELKDSDGAILGTDNYTVTSGLLLPSDKEKEGYVFIGWYENSDYSGDAVARIEIGETGNRGYYAKWAEEYYTVTLSVNFASVDNQDAVFYLGEAETEARSFEVGYGETFVLPTVKVRGFTFNGWFLNGVQLTSGEGNSFAAYTEESDVQLTADFTRHEYIIKIQQQEDQFVWFIEGGITGVAGSTVPYSLDLSPNEQILQWKISTDSAIKQMYHDNFYREGHIFICLVDGAGNVFSLHNVELADGAEYTAYTYYETEKYDLYFDGYAQFNRQDVPYNSLFEAPQATKDYYEPAVWQYDNALDQRVAFPAYLPDLSVGEEKDDSTILFAYFEPIEYTIEAHYLGGTAEAGTIPETYNYESSFILPPAVRTGYAFEGWYTDANYTGDAVENIELHSHGNISLYAKWVKVYRLIIRGEGGYQVTVNLQDGESYTLPVKSDMTITGNRDYYDGWWKGDIGTFAFGATVSFSEAQGDLWNQKTLRISWTGKYYNIYYNNLTHGGGEAYHSNPLTYQYGVGLTFQAAVIPYQPYNPYFVFIGWYTDSRLTQKITGIGTEAHQNFGVYARWKYVCLGGGRYHSFTVNDDGRMKQNYDDIWIKVGNNDYSVLNNMGFRYLRIKLSVLIREVNDGNQYVFFYNGSSTSATQLNFRKIEGNDVSGYINEWHIEHGPGEEKKSEQWHDIDCVIDLSDISYLDQLYIRYGADGKGADTWHNDAIKYEMEYLTHIEDRS